MNYSIEWSLRDEGHTHVIKAMENLLPSNETAGQKILDVGCGTGYLLKRYAVNNAVYGVDNMREALEIATQRGVNASMANLNNSLHFKENSFDVVFLDIFEHLLYPEILLHEIYRVLKPGGKLILNLPNHFNWSGRYKILKGSGLDVFRWFPGADDYNNPHVRFFTYDGAVRFVHLVPFQSIKDYSYFFPRVFFRVKGVILKKIAIHLAHYRQDLFAAGFLIIGIK